MQFVNRLRLTLIQCMILSTLCSYGLSSDIDKLKATLLDGYDQHSHPGQGNVTVSVGLQVIHLTDVDIINGKIVLQAWQILSWNDHRLKWNKEEHNNVGLVHLLVDQVWRPDIELYNNVGSKADIPTSNVVLLSNGTVRWSYQTTYGFSCSMNSENFPYDATHCFLKFGSWTYDGFYIDLELDPKHNDEETTNEIGNSQWNFDYKSSNRNVKYYTCCEEPYLDVTFNYVLERRSSYYHLLLVVPMIVAMILTLGTFLLPPPSGERITMVSVAALILIVIHLYLGFKLAPSPSAPRIVKYANHVLFNVAFALVLSVMGIRKCRVTPIPPPPGFVRKMIDGFLAKLFCLGPMKAQISEIRMASSPNSVELGSPKDQPKQDQASHTQTLYLHEWMAFLTMMDRFNFVMFFLNFTVSYFVMM